MIGATGPGPGGQAAPRPTVQTVRGPVPVTELGRVFMHEHVFVLNEEIRQNYVTDWDEEQQVAAAAGCLLGMDRFGLDIVLPRERRVATVAALAARGYADRIVLSHDVSCHIDWFPAGLIGVFAPDWHLEHLLDDVLPALRDSGVSDEQIDTMLVASPRRYFTPRGAAAAG